MLRIYYIPLSSDNYVISAQSYILNNLLPFRIPCKFRSDITEDDNRSSNILDYFMLGHTTQCNTSQCHFTYKSPEILDFNKAYMNDKDTNVMLKNI